jgi:hypothetical protein
MKNATLIMFLSILTLFTLAQDSANTTFKIKDYSLRDYVAPDIKYRRLDASTQLNGQGGENHGYQSGYLNFRFMNYVNTKMKQSQSVSGLTGNYNVDRRGYDGNDMNSYRSAMFYHNQFRRYNSNASFFGVHTQLEYGINKFTSISPDTNNAYQSVLMNEMHLTMFLSYGKGRIEPVASARKAMDILISLEKNNRLSKSPDKAMVDSLARIANRIQYKRFFDRRYKRVYQLNELDKGIQALGLVDNTDMVYAANLSDVWDFALDFNRGSGQRLEFGVIPLLNLNADNRTVNPNYQYGGSDYSQTVYTYGMYGFGSWNKMTPINYKWQSDIMIDLTAGWYENGDNSGNSSSVSGVSSLLNASWSLGYYPSTRTYLSLTPFARASITTATSSSETYGLFTGLDLRSYYYVSPRLRVSVNAGIGVGSDEYNQNTPTPFWNTAAVNNQMVQTNTDVITSPSSLYNESANYPNDFRYQYRVVLSYAIF